MNNLNLNHFFNPQSIAVVGASSDKSKVGYALMANLINVGGGVGEVRPLHVEAWPRHVYPVSLSETEISGLKVYKSIKEIEESIDLAIIAVRADIVPSVLEDCASKNIRSVIIISAGFGEIGLAGRELEEKCLKIAKEKGISLLGPNCLGIINPVNNFNASFANGSPRKGSIAFLSQSGALGTSMFDLATKEGIGFSKFVSLGNETDLTEIEFLKYLAEDTETKAILIYLEKLANGSEFLKIASEITKTKPIVVLKAGRSERGIRAVQSHTGSLAPADAVFSGACRQAGIVAVESIREFFNLAKLFQSGITRPLRNLVILTNGGGPSVVAADLVDLSAPLSLVELKEETKDALKKVLPPMAAFGNPIDIIGDALAKRYEDALDIIVKEKDVEGILLILTPQMMTEVEATAQLVLQYREKKPILPIFLGGPSVEPGLKIFRDNNIPNFTFPKDAVEALEALASTEVQPRYAEVAPRETETPDLHQIPFAQMTEILKEQKLSLPGELVKEKHDLIKVISKIGQGPYALKVISPDLVHKTDAGVIRLNLNSLEEAQKAWDELEKRVKDNFPQAHIEGIVFQKMGFGREVIVGLKRDPVFGPAVLFGLGGIFTEALKDTSIRIAPFEKEMALKMINEINGQAILNGLRGEKAIDFDSLAEVIVAIGRIGIDHPEIKEIDLNPVMVNENGAVIVDARMMA